MSNIISFIYNRKAGSFRLPPPLSDPSVVAHRAALSATREEQTRGTCCRDVSAILKDGAGRQRAVGAAMPQSPSETAFDGSQLGGDMEVAGLFPFLESRNHVRFGSLDRC